MLQARARAIQTQEVASRSQASARIIDRTGNVVALDEERFTLWAIPLLQFSR